MALWTHCSLTKNSFLYSSFKGGLWITSAPDCEAWWLELNSQSAGTQRCLALSCVSVLFSNRIHKAKFLQNIRVIVILSRPLNLQGLFGTSKRERIPCRLVSDPDLAQPVVPWGNIMHISKLPEAWGENASCCECRLMLPSQPRVSLVWIRSGSSGDLSWQWVSHHPHDFLQGWGSATVPGTQKKRHWTLLSCCYMQAGLLIKSEPDLKGNGKEISILVLADIWELTQVWMQLGFLSSFLTGSLLAWEPEFLGPKSSLTYLQLRFVIHPRVQFPISWMMGTGLAP